MFHKGKLLAFLGSFLIVLYAVSAVFYGRVVARDDAYKELSIFMEVLKKINDDYVEPPNMNVVQDGAMRGLIGALDGQSSFLTREQYEAVEKRKGDGGAGLGIVISKRADVIYVVSVEENSPAAEAGVRPGDYLIAVDGRSVEDKSVLEADSLLHGAPGAPVKVTVFRSSRPKPLELSMVFRHRVSPAVHSRMLDGKVGLLDVASLAGDSLEQTRIKLKTLISAGAERILLDLRNCADGSPTAGAELANFFLRDGVIYYSRNREGEKVEVIEASPEKHLTDLPMAVLINGSTAGAAEITAGALKDRKRATVVGEKSFGVGSAQKTIPLKSGAVLILSTAKFCTPDGKVIQDAVLRKTGIIPDIQVPDDDKRQELAVESYYDEKDDEEKYRQFLEKVDSIQTDKALEILIQAEAPLKKAA